MKRHYFSARNKIEKGYTEKGYTEKDYTAIVLATDEDDARRLMSEYSSKAGLADLWSINPVEFDEIPSIEISCDYLIQDTMYEGALGLGDVVSIHILDMVLPFGEFIANTDVSAFAHDNIEHEETDSDGVLYTVEASPYAHMSGTIRVPEGEDVREYVDEHFDEIDFGEPDFDFAGTDIEILDEEGEAIDNED